jgi:hypothetical protein
MMNFEERFSTNRLFVPTEVGLFPCIRGMNMRQVEDKGAER